MRKITLYKTMSLFFLLMLAVSCNDPSPLPQIHTPSSATIDTPIPIAQNANLTYEVIESVPTTEAGTEFEITTNNCGSDVTATETYSRSREFEVRLIQEDVVIYEGTVGGSIFISEAEIKAAVETSLGVQVGSQETVSVDRQVTTPADTLKVVIFRWDEIWEDLTVAVMDENGVIIAEVPGRVLTNISLTQLDIQETPCTLTPTPSPTPVIQGEIVDTWIFSHYENTTPEFEGLLDEEGYFTITVPGVGVCRYKPASFQFDSHNHVERCLMVEITFNGNTYKGEDCIDGTYSTYSIEDVNTVYLKIPEPENENFCSQRGSVDEAMIYINGNTLKIGGTESDEVTAVYERR